MGSWKQSCINTTYMKWKAFSQTEFLPSWEDARTMTCTNESEWSLLTHKNVWSLLTHKIVSHQSSAEQNIPRMKTDK